MLYFLEPRLGLPGTEADPIERILAYKNALGTIKENDSLSTTMDNLSRIENLLPKASRLRRGLGFNPDNNENKVWILAKEKTSDSV